MVDGDNRFRAKCRSCRPCENTRSTAVEVANRDTKVSIVLAERIVDIILRTWNRKKVKCHPVQCRIHVAVIVPPHKWVIGLDGEAQVLIKRSYDASGS